MSGRHPSREGCQVLVPAEVFQAALNYIRHVGSNHVSRGEPHPQQWIVDCLELAAANQPVAAPLTAKEIMETTRECLNHYGTMNERDVAMRESIFRLRDALLTVPSESGTPADTALISASDFRLLSESERYGAYAELRQRVVKAAYRPSPMCRDCADRDGTCYDGTKCDPFEAALDTLRAAPSASTAIAPAEAYVLAIQQSVGSILSQYAANMILDRAKEIANGN